MRRLFLPLCLALALLGGHAKAAQLAACTTGATNCSNDTTNDNGVVNNALLDGGMLNRVWFLAMQQCAAFVYPEAISGGITLPIHLARVGFCNSIAAAGTGSPLRQAIVAYVMNLTVEGELLAGSGPGGNMVDADINAALNTLLTVSGGTSVATTGTATSGSEAVTVASGTGIQAGQNAFCAGCAAGATVAYASGTTVQLSAPVTAALSGTAIVFVTPLSGPAVGNF